MLEQALATGWRIAVIAETCSDPSDDVVTSLMQQLPPDVAAEARVYSTSMARQPLLDPEDTTTAAAAATDGFDDAAAGSSGSSGLDAAAGTSLAAAAGRVKQKGAQEFVQRLAAALAGKDAAVGVQLHPSLQMQGDQGRGVT